MVQAVGKKYGTESKEETDQTDGWQANRICPLNWPPIRGSVVNQNYWLGRQGRSGQV